MLGALAPARLSIGGFGQEVRAAPRSPARNGAATTFFPWCAHAAFLARQESLAAPSSAALWPHAVRGDRLPAPGPPSRPHGAAPGISERDFPWRSSAASPRTRTATPGRSARSASTPRRGWSPPRAAPTRCPTSGSSPPRQRGTGCGLDPQGEGDGARIPLGQARRPELPPADLREPGRGRGRGQLQPDLVPLTTAPPHRAGRFVCTHAPGRRTAPSPPASPKGEEGTSAGFPLSRRPTVGPVQPRLRRRAQGKSSFSCDAQHR